KRSEEGRPPTTRLVAGAVGSSQGPLQGGGWMLVGSRPLERPARRGDRLQGGWLQGARKGLLPTIAPWQAGCRWTRAAVTCVGVVVATTAVAVAAQ
ncbi:hypothetical protein GW17_00053956, partial [Ensete ventricosum]